MTESGDKAGHSVDPQLQPLLIQSLGGEPFVGLITLPAGITGPAAGPRGVLAIRALIEALPNDGTLIIAGHASALRAAGSWPELTRRIFEFLPVDDAIDFTIWSQDAFLACLDGDRVPVALFPARDRRRPDAIVAEAAAVAAGIDVRRADFDFEGGNVLVGTSTVLVGADTHPLDPAILAARFSALGGTGKVIALGTGARMPSRSIRLLSTPNGPLVEEVFGHTGIRQPLFHLDAFITFAGRAADDRDIVLVGDSRMAAEPVDGGRPSLSDQCVADQLDGIADQIAAVDELLVVRNPLPIIPIVNSGLRAWSRNSVEREFGGVDGVEDVLLGLDRRGIRTVAIRRWRAATQNSAIVFATPGGTRRVLLPTYAHGRYSFLSRSEGVNRRLWLGLGFEVIELPDFIPFTADNGSLHCMFKFISSGRAEPRPPPFAPPPSEGDARRQSH